MGTSIKISDNEISHLREEAKISSRSLAGQTEHWLRIGRAIEHSNSFDYQHIRNALKGLSSPDDLSASEQAVYIEELSEFIWEPSPGENTFFEKRRQQGLGVGLDEENNIIHQDPKV